MIRFNPPKEEEILACAQQKLSMTQTYRKLKLGGPSWLFKYLKQPGKESLHAMFVENGKIRQKSHSLRNYVETSEITFPPNYTKLPKGYKVYWKENIKKYVAFNENNNIESPSFDSRYIARNWCFNNAGIEFEKKYGKI